MDWQTLLRGIARAQRLGSAPPDDYWAQFQALAARSPQAEALADLVQRGPSLPPSVRLMMVTTVVRLLAAVEWPAEWEAARVRLVSGIQEILHESDIKRAESLPAVLGLVEDTDLVAWVLVLRRALALLETPCPPSELPTVASLCNLAMGGCLRRYRNRLVGVQPARPDEAPSPRLQFELAYMAYANAARDLNAAAGAVMFLIVQRPFGDV